MPKINIPGCTDCSIEKKQEILRRRYWQLPAIIAGIYIVFALFELFCTLGMMGSAPLGILFLMAFNVVGSCYMILSLAVLSVQISKEKENARLLTGIVLMAAVFKAVMLILLNIFGSEWYFGDTLFMTAVLVLSLYLGTFMSGYSMKISVHGKDRLNAYRKETTGFKNHCRAAYADWVAKGKNKIPKKK